MPLPSVDPTAPKTVVLRVLEPLFLTSAGTWTLKHVSRHIDPTLMRLSRGRVSTVMVRPAVLLTTTGAKTGLERTVALLYFTDRGRVVLMASNFGGTKHPAWYRNVTANPEVTLSAGGHRGRFVAEEAVGDEHERLWSLAKEFTRGYAAYEQTTEGREIPVILFTPVDQTAA